MLYNQENGTSFFIYGINKDFFYIFIFYYLEKLLLIGMVFFEFFVKIYFVNILSDKKVNKVLY